MITCKIESIVTFGLKEGFVQGVAEPAASRVVGHVAARAAGLAAWGYGWFNMTRALNGGCEEKCEAQQEQFLRGLYNSRGN